jgi:integrase
MPWGDEQFPRVRRPHKLPVVLSQEEVVQFFDHVPSLKYRAVLMACYGSGLRISEAVALKVGDVDSQRMLIRVEQGKGRKDRYVMLSPRLLEVLRIWWRAARPQHWLFPGWRTGRHITAPSIQAACREASLRCGLRKRITAHTLRHYAGFRTIPGQLKFGPIGGSFASGFPA